MTPAERALLLTVAEAVRSLSMFYPTLNAKIEAVVAEDQRRHDRQVAGASRGGFKRAQALTPERRREIGRMGGRPPGKGKAK